MGLYVVEPPFRYPAALLRGSSFVNKSVQYEEIYQITSPPYNNGKEYETVTSLKQYLEKIKPIIAESVRALSDDGSICWEVGNYIDGNTREAFPLDIYYSDKQLSLCL